MHLRGAAAAGRLMPFNRPRPKGAIRGRCVQVRRRPPISNKEADLRDAAAGAASCLGSQTGSQAASSHSNQSFAEHDLNMHLDRGFCAVFACWLHVCSAAGFRISIAWEIEPAGCRIQKVC